MTKGPPESPAPAERPGPRRLLRRLFPLIALGAAAAGLFALAPAKTTLSYDLGARREGLCSLEVDLFKLPGRELARRTQFLYSAAAPAPASQVQSLRLDRGDYEADLDLGQCGGGHRQFQTRFHFEGQDWVSVPITGP